MVTKNKLLKKKNTLENHGEDRKSSEALELPSFWTATLLNEKFWMRKAGIYSERVYNWVWAKNAGFTHKKQEKTLAPHTFWMLGEQAML